MLIKNAVSNMAKINKFSQFYDNIHFEMSAGLLCFDDLIGSKPQRKQKINEAKFVLCISHTHTFTYFGKISM